MRRLFSTTLVLLTLAAGTAAVVGGQDGCDKTPVATTGTGQKVIVAAPAAGQLWICQSQLSTTASMTLTLDWDQSKLPLRSGDGYVALPNDTLPAKTALSFTVSASASIRGFVRTKIVNVPVPDPDPPQTPTPTATPTPTVTPTPTSTPIPPPPGTFPNEPPLTMNDLEYRGTFKVATGSGFTIAEYGGRAIKYDPYGDGGKGSLWATGFDDMAHHPVAEYCGLDAVLAQISPTHTTLAQMPTIGFCPGQNYTDGLTARINALITAPNGIRTGGIYPLDSMRLVMNFFGNYGKPSSNLIIVSKTLSAPTVLSGPSTVLPSSAIETCALTAPNGVTTVSCDTGWVGGHIGDVPPQWQALLGGDVCVTGFGASVMSTQSAGPNLTCFWKADIGVKDPIPARRVLGYPAVTGYDHQTLGNYDGNLGSKAKWCGGEAGEAGGPQGFIIVPGYRSVWYWGQHGDCTYTAYGVTTNTLDADGNVSPPIWPDQSGTGASTSADGRRITIPGADVTNCETSGGNSNWWIWLKTQPGPLKLQRGRTHKAATKIIGCGNSGTPTAYVDVPANWSTAGTTFASNLTGQDWGLSHRQAVYDPTQPNMKGAGAFMWPLQYAVRSYDLAQLATSLTGTPYWTHVPEIVTFTLPYAYNPNGKLGVTQPRVGLKGADYDGSRRLIYVVQDNAEGSNLNERWIVNVWRVKTPPATTQTFSLPVK